MVAASPRILEAQRGLTASFDPDEGYAAPTTEQIERVAFAIFKSFSRDTQIFAAGMTKDEAFRARWKALQPQTRDQYEQMAMAAIRAAH